MRASAPSHCLVFLALLSACTIQEAPTELSEINRFLFREWSSESEQLLAEALLNFDEQMAEVELDGSLGQRSFIPENLQEGDVSSLSHPERALTDLLGVAVGHKSPWSSADHVLLIVAEDQTPVQPTAPLYQRIFTGESDPQCFAARECMRITSMNEVRRENLLMSVDFSVAKDYRWVPITTDSGAERWGIVGRSWFSESFPADDGDSILWQSFTLDIWLDRADEGLLRYQSMWTETEIPGVSDADIVRGTIRLSLDDTFDAEDNFLDELIGER